MKPIEGYDSRRASRRFVAVLAATLAAVHVGLAPSVAAQPDAYTVMRSYGYFDVFCDLIERAGLVGAFQVAGPITVFAPDDEAFSTLSPEERRALEDPARVAELRERILYHVVDERLSSFEIKREKPRITATGLRVKFLDMAGALMVNDAFIDTEDIRASNGLVHAIDKVLTPPSN